MKQCTSANNAPYVGYKKFFRLIFFYVSELEFWKFLQFSKWYDKNSVVHFSGNKKRDFCHVFFFFFFFTLRRSFGHCIEPCSIALRTWLTPICDCPICSNLWEKKLITCEAWKRIITIFFWHISIRILDPVACTGCWF